MPVSSGGGDALVRRVAHHEQPQRGVTDVHVEVEHGAAARDGRQVLGERLEVPRDTRRQRLDVHVLDVLERASDRRVVLGSRRRDREAAVARDHRRHAVERRRRERGIPEHLRVVVGVDVDEPRRHDLARGVELPRAVGVELRPDLHDAPALDRDVGGVAGRAGAVDDGAAPDHDVGAHAGTSLWRSGVTGRPSTTGPRSRTAPCGRWAREGRRAPRRRTAAARSPGCAGRGADTSGGGSRSRTACCRGTARARTARRRARTRSSA